MLEAINIVGYAAIFAGHPGYHVVVECGTQTSISKTSSSSFHRDFLALSLSSEIDFFCLIIRLVQEIWTKSTGTKSSCLNCQSRSWKL